MEGKEIFGTKYGENSIRSDCRLKTQGMSDLYMHECVDISWDDYFLNDDRMVPHHGSKRLNDHFIPGEHNKRCRHELVSIANNTGGSATKYVDHGKEIPPPLSKTRNTVLEKDTWSHQEASSLACESTMPVPHVPKNNKYLSSSELVKPDMTDFTSNGIFENVENKDSSDLLYSAWSEVENFDDIERMFRTDPTLGLGICKEDDDMSWLSSADVYPGDGRNSDVKTISENHDSYSCLENPVSDIHSRDSHLSYDSYPSIVKTETPFSTDSGHASSQMEYMDGFAGPSFKETGLVVSGEREEPQSCQGKHDGLQNRRGLIQTRIPNSGLVGTYENHYDSQESSLANASEMDSSIMQERSTTVPDLDDISLEAASFRQLQLVTKQLDLRTKICIRDSLYRLAHSAEQRRSNPKLHRTFGDEREAAGGASEAKGTNSCSSFMDMETDTNPIDRSVAHLLFNRPSDSSTNIGSA